jgi:hypothetical protein
MAAVFPRLTPFRLTLLAVLVGVLGVVCWNVFVRDDPQPLPPDPPPLVAGEVPSDPRLAFATPFRNVKPGVHYVGDAACAPCHRDIDKTYHAHPMGRSAELVAKATPIERYDVAAHNPNFVGPYELFVEKAGTKVLHRVRAKDVDGKPLSDYVTVAHLAIGSGTRGRSYVCVEQGAAWQTPISWFSPNARWDVSPGFDLGNGGRRPILSKCLFCHVNQNEPVPLSVNRYRETLPSVQLSIGCERCHGPGEIHVTERTAGVATERIDTSIVNPKHLSADLRDGICAQCHLQGEQRVVRLGRELNDFRPGLPLEQFVSTFVRHPHLADLKRSVGQFEQMHESKCFIQSAGRLGCTSCHDPHSKPAEVGGARHYADRCMTCHGVDSKECSERLAVRKLKDDNCLDCHMPKSDSSSIVHASVTDHRVPRRPIASIKPFGLEPGDIPLVRFSVGSHGPGAMESDRDLGIALVQAMRSAPANGRRQVGSLAEPRLRTSVSIWREDIDAWNALCLAREALVDWDGALQAAMTATGLRPESEEAQAHVVSAAMASGKFDLAIEAANALIRLNPSSVEPFLLRAGVFVVQREWKKAEADYRSALAIHPLHPDARLFWAICRHHLGDIEGGKKESQTAANLATKPQQRSAMLEYYRSSTE